MYSKKISLTEMASIIDHTNLKPYATRKDIEKLCSEAKEYNFGAVCVNSHYVGLCKSLLKDSDVEIASVVGFPLGASSTEAKACETADAVQNGATEIDMVMNIGEFKNKNYDFVKEDITRVVDAAEGTIVKVILETGYLTDEEIIEACKIVVQAGAHFVKTSTGFGPMGAYVDHVRIMRDAVGENFGVKAAGGIRTAKDAVRMVNAGANRLGASAGVKIIESLKEVLENNKWFTEEDDDPEKIYSWGHADPKKQPKEVYEYYIRKKEIFYQNIKK